MARKGKSGKGRKTTKNHGQDAHATEPRRTRFRRWFRLFVILLILTTVGVSVAVSGLLVYLGTLPPIDSLERYAPPQVTRVVDRTGRVNLTRFKRENRVVVGVDEIPDLLIKAFIAAEDEHFYEHFGIDFVAVLRAMWHNLKQRRLREGFSTITMQLPRNIKGGTTRERKLKRKLRDIVLALQIERRYSKDQILEFYLNQVYLGSGSYGVKAAAKTYFNKGEAVVRKTDQGTTEILSGLHDLTLAECAMVAGLPQAPSLDSPLRNPKRAKRRRDLVLWRMLQSGYIDDEVYERTRLEPVETHPPSAARNRAPYLVEYLKTWLGGNPDFSHYTLESGGFIIRSTLDTRIQAICDEELRAGLQEAELKWQQRKTLQLSQDERTGTPPRDGEVRLAEIAAVSSNSLTVRIMGYRATVSLPEYLPYYQPEKILLPGNLVDVQVSRVDHEAGKFEAGLFDAKPIQGAAVVLHARTGEILALSGGYDFYDEPSDGQWNRAVQAERQAGSCFKPFVYALALESDDWTPATIYHDDEPTVYRRFPGDYKPKNYEKVHFGPTTLLVALEHSRNVPTVFLYQDLIDRLGVRQVAGRLGAFDVVGEPSWNIRPADVTVALGSAGLTPLELAAAYTTFVNQGVALEPICVREVTDLDHNMLRRFRPTEKVLLSPQTAFQVIHLLRAAILRGTGRPVRRYFDEVRTREPGRLIPEMGGKTGTTNDCTDAWFAGMTPELIVVVFMGFDSPRSLGPRMSGSYVAAPTWCRIVDRVLQTRKTWQMRFAEPPGIEYADVDAETGVVVAQGQSPPSGTLLRHVPFKRGKATMLTRP